MSKLLFGLLLAGAAAPALAAGGPHDRHRDDYSSQQQDSRAERPARNNEQARPQFDRPARAEVERPQFSGRPQFNGGERPQFNARPQWAGDRAQFNGERPQPSRDGQTYRPQFRENPYSQQAPDSVRNWRPREQAQTSGYYQQQRQVRTNDNLFLRNDGQWRNDGARDGRPRAFRNDGYRDSRVQWNTHWRDDRRYDWRDRRRYHSSLFHIGLYVDPFGWGYQPYSIGYRLYPNYYEQNYWIDPGMYGLPFPPPGMQWVRYYNDALLIDMYSGQVVDAIQGFFW